MLDAHYNSPMTLPPPSICVHPIRLRPSQTLIISSASISARLRVCFSLVTPLPAFPNTAVSRIQAHIPFPVMRLTTSWAGPHGNIVISQSTSSSPSSIISSQGDTPYRRALAGPIARGGLISCPHFPEPATGGVPRPHAVPQNNYSVETAHGRFSDRGGFGMTSPHWGG